MSYYCVSVLCLLFFFFKQKTAYEMRISDWSSDVCSSDLVASGRPIDARRRGLSGGGYGDRDAVEMRHSRYLLEIPWPRRSEQVDVDAGQFGGAPQAALVPPSVRLVHRTPSDLLADQTGRAACRERACTYV